MYYIIMKKIPHGTLLLKNYGNDNTSSTNNNNNNNKLMIIAIIVIIFCKNDRIKEKLEQMFIRFANINGGKKYLRFNCIVYLTKCLHDPIT